MSVLERYERLLKAKLASVEAALPVSPPYAEYPADVEKFSGHGDYRVSIARFNARCRKARAWEDWKESRDLARARAREEAWEEALADCRASATEEEGLDY